MTVVEHDLCAVRRKGRIAGLETARDLFQLRAVCSSDPSLSYDVRVLVIIKNHVLAVWRNIRAAGFEPRLREPLSVFAIRIDDPYRRQQVVGVAAQQNMSGIDSVFSLIVIEENIC